MLDEIFERLKNSMPEKYEKETPGFLIYDTLKAFAIEYSKMYKSLDLIAKKLDPKNLIGEELERETALRRGIKRKPATYSTGKLYIKGTAQIKYGSLFSTVNNITFSSEEDKDISREGFIKIKCSLPGEIGNVGANSINQIPITIPGIEKINNPKGTYGGFEEESDKSLLERYIEDIKKPINSNNVYHFEKWARNVPGVGRAKIIPTWNGNNSVKVVILDNNMLPAPLNIVEACQNYIDPKDQDKWGKGYGQAALGSYCTVIPASAKECEVYCQIQKSSNYSQDFIKNQAEKLIISYFKDLAFNNKVDFVSYAKVAAIIVEIEGVIDLGRFTLNSKNENITLNNEEVPVLSAITIEVIK